jgi:hypothetical protein
VVAFGEDRQLGAAVDRTDEVRQRVGKSIQAEQPLVRTKGGPRDALCPGLGRCETSDQSKSQPKSKRKNAEAADERRKRNWPASTFLRTSRPVVFSLVHHNGVRAEPPHIVVHNLTQMACRISPSLNLPSSRFCYKSKAIIDCDGSVG